MEYIKKAAGGDDKTQDVSALVRDIIAQVEAGGESAVLELAQKLDGWDKSIIVSPDHISAAVGRVSKSVKDDICFARDRVRHFAEAQKATLQDCEVTLAPGLIAGQKNIPVNAVGCYVPGGRYAHVASAVMSTTTAKVAGVPHIIAASPPHEKHGGIHPAILYALHECGADVVLNLGGAHAIAALAFGLFSGQKADMLVGPGNQFVAEAKRQLYGRVGIDMFAGPTEILIIADETADAEIVAADLVGQAEHGHNSPAWLITLNKKLGEQVAALAPSFIGRLPEPNQTHAASAWRDYGEIVFTENADEAALLGDKYAAEHVQVHTADAQAWKERLTNYGSLFIGEETTVAFGDKASGPNHILPTLGAARYSGGLSVGKLMKTVTWQQCDRQAVRDLAPVVARLSRLEGMEAHARTADIRLQKWFGDENFCLNNEEKSP